MVPFSFQKDAVEHINLKVLGQDGQVVHFKIKQHTSLKKLMSAYCARSKLAQSTVRFRFDGQAISENDTPRDLDMEDGDTIEVFQQQTGGVFQQSCIFSTEEKIFSHNRFMKAAVPSSSAAAIQNNTSCHISKANNCNCHIFNSQNSSDDALTSNLSDVNEHSLSFHILS